MNSLVGYGSDDEVESDQFGHRSSVGAGGKRKEDDTNYDDVNMDLSEDSQDGGSEPELPAAGSAPGQRSKSTRQGSNDSREREHDRDRHRDRDGDRDRTSDMRDRTSDMRDRRREKERYERDRERRSPRRDDRYSKDRSDRSRGSHDAPRRGLLGDKPHGQDRSENKVPALMDLKPYGGEPPPGLGRSHDARDAVSPRFVDRERRERDDRRERDRDRESRHTRRSEETRSSRDKGSEHRSRSRGAAFPPPYSSSSNERRSSPSSGDYRPSSYKVNKKLEVMEKMGLQIKTPDGSMATAQQLRAAASEAPPGSGPGVPAFNPTIANSNKILDQVQKRKLLWSNKEKSVAVAEAAKWSGARFAQDNDGKQVSKFMRLMGIKEPAAVKAPEQVDETVDPNKKQEELFQAMQAQYEVARATTHTMRGVGLGFQRGNF